MIRTDSRTPVKVDCSGQADRHTVAINSSKVARTEFLSWDISRRSVVRGWMCLIIWDLFPRQGGYVFGDVCLFEARDVTGECWISEGCSLAVGEFRGFDHYHQHLRSNFGEHLHLWVVRLIAGSSSWALPSNPPNIFKAERTTDPELGATIE